MMNRFYLLVTVFITSTITIHAQSLLDRNVSLEVNRQRLDHVLEIVSNKANFYFSYNSNIIRSDSLVSLSVRNQPVRQVLRKLLPDHYEFRESGQYLIIRKTPITLTMKTGRAVTRDPYYTISGHVLDDETGAWIRNASIYEKNQLASALTNGDGFFSLRLRHKSHAATLSVSKEFYQDTSFSVDAGYNQQYTITLLPVTSGSLTLIGPDDYFAPDHLKLRVQKDSLVTEYTYVKADSARVEKTGMAKFLVSSQQRIQSLNLKKFFTTRPFQVSLTPGLGTHGSLSGQVTNNFSFNVFGGYNGGVNGLEIGGLFNLDKKSVQYVQVGGLFNIVGGQVRGLQVGGLNNTVLDSVKGFQVAGINNHVKGSLHGLQVGGVYNHVTNRVQGAQVAGVANFAKQKVSGSQVAGVANFSNRELTGAQVGLFNFARQLKGVQIGLINISDTSEGFSIGLINVVLKGYHKLAFSANELVNLNAAFKTGSPRLYNILQAGFHLGDSNEVFTFGYGLGTELKLGRTFTLNPEFTAQHLYLGSWDFANILGKAQLNLNLKLGKYVSIFGGPVFNAYYSIQDIHIPGYRKQIPPAGYKTYSLAANVKGWLGWNAGISFF